MTRLLIAAAASAAALMSFAVAQEPPPPPGGAGEITKDAPESLKGAAPHQDDAGRLIAFARDLREEKGCAAASPAFRVIAGMGEGQEAAQHELGECLLELKGASEVETALFRQEGEFWLTRAAFAGNARAQRKLVLEMASPASALHNPKGALMWALIYGKNPTADLYGYAPLPATLVPGLKSSLNEADIAEAENFAKDFAPIMLAKFEGPKRDAKRSAFGERPDRPQGGGRRRRPG
ncbi:MAG: hypothetical protein ACOZAA_02865 [Pseudomonadota bacterium]